MRRVIVLRPEPAAGRTAARATAMEMDVRVHPLFAPQAVEWTPPPASHFDALLLTSAHAARLAGPALAAYRRLPAYAVGEATAGALRPMSFADIVAGTGDGSAIAARMGTDGHRRILHLAGTTVAPMAAGTLDIQRIAVYSMTGLPPDPMLRTDATPGSVLLIHSSRAGERLAAQLPVQARASLHIVAISTAALTACGDGWASGQAAALPQDDEMLALAARLCE